MRKILLLAVNQLFETHLEVCERFEWTAAVKDPFAMRAAVVDTHQALLRGDIQPDLFVIAVSYAHNIVKYKPFLTGNIRTAIKFVEAFLDLNGVGLESVDDDITRVMFQLEAGAVTLEQAAEAVADAAYELPVEA